MQLSDKVKLLRKNQGITQEQLAESANVTLRTIQRIEGGETVPRGHTLLSIAKALGITIEQLHSEKSSDIAGVSDDGSKSYIQYLNLSSFAYLILPYGNLLFPWLLWRRKKSVAIINQTGKKILMRQFLWTIATHVSLLVVLMVKLLAKYYWNTSMGPIILLTFFLMYFINIPIILHTSLKLKRSA